MPAHGLGRVSEIEVEIAKLVASSLEGILWQARILKRLGVYDLEIDARPRRCHNALIANIIAGLKRLSASGAGDVAAVTTPPDDSRF
jgi:hypothetical protein